MFVLLGGVLVGAEFIDPAEGEGKLLVHAGADRELKRERESLVDVVFGGEERDAVGELRDVEVLLEVGVNGALLGFHGQELEIAAELGEFLGDGDRGDRGLLGLHDALRLALALVDDHVVVAVILLRELGDLLLRVCIYECRSDKPVFVLRCDVSKKAREAS